MHCLGVADLKRWQEHWWSWCSGALSPGSHEQQNSAPTFPLVVEKQTSGFLLFCVLDDRFSFAYQESMWFLNKGLGFLPPVELLLERSESLHLQKDLEKMLSVGQCRCQQMFVKILVQFNLWAKDLCCSFHTSTFKTFGGCFGSYILKAMLIRSTELVRSLLVN